MTEKSRENFLKYVSCVELDHVEHVRLEKELLTGFDDRKLTKDLPEGFLYVTWGDDEPWLQINTCEGYSISLEPQLAFYWLDRIKEFYDKYNTSEQSITEEKE